MVSSRAVVANICFIFVCVFGVDISFKGGGCKLGANVGEGDKKAPLFPCYIGMGGAYMYLYCYCLSNDSNSIHHLFVDMELRIYIVTLLSYY